MIVVEASFSQILSHIHSERFVIKFQLFSQHKKCEFILTTILHTSALTDSDLITGKSSAKKKKELVALDLAADGLRTRYLGQLPTAKADWPKHHVTNYIRLALVEKEDITDCRDQLNYITTLTLRGGVDRILKIKEPIYDLREIFHYNSEPIPRLILIMGGPGM